MMFENRVISRALSRLVTTAAAALLVLGMGATQPAHAGYSGIFGGGPFYNNAGVSIPEIKNSGFTEAIVWNIQVHSNGDLNFNGEFPLCSNGAYVGNQTHSDFAANMAALKTGTIKRVTFSIGSSNVGDWQDIKALVNAQGTGSTSILYKNFQALKAAIPALDAVDFDDENSYDSTTTVAFAVMLGNLGYKVMLDPYTNSGYWINLASTINSQRPGTVDGVHLQCYSGGAGNNPNSGWNFGSVPVYPGLWDADDTPSQVQTILTGWHVSGGFMWLYDDFVGNGKAAQYASAINTATGIGNTGTTVNLSSSFNRAGIYTDGTTFSTGGLDGVGYAYSSNLLGTSRSWSNANFTIGTANTSNVVKASGQTITLPSARYSSLKMLATAVQGNQTSQSFVVHYSDGTQTSFTQSLSDWFTPQSYSGEQTAVSMSYRDTSSGGRDSRTFNLYGYSFSLNNTKTVSSITLPNNANVEVIAITAVP